MDIGTIISLIGALGTIGSVARAKGKQKRARFMPLLSPFVFVLPNPTPTAEPLPSEPQQATARLRNLITRKPAERVRGFLRDLPHNAVEMPKREPPPNVVFPSFRPDPSLRELYELYYGVGR